MLERGYIGLIIALLYICVPNHAIAESKTILSECQADEKKADYSAGPKWCQCLNDQFKKVLTAKEILSAVQDYEAFRRKQIEDPSISHDWRYNNVLVTCRNCKESNYVGCLDMDTARPDVKSYEKIIGHLQSGDFSYLQKSRVYRQFYVDYIARYSETCQQHIKKGQRRTTTLTKTFGDGRSEEYKTQILVEDGYMNTFVNYETTLKQELVGDFLGMMRGGSTLGKTNDILKSAYASEQVLKKHLKNGCLSDAVQKTYRSIHRFDKDH